MLGIIIVHRLQQPLVEVEEVLEQAVIIYQQVEVLETHLQLVHHKEIPEEIILDLDFMELEEVVQVPLVQMVEQVMEMAEMVQLIQSLDHQ